MWPEEEEGDERLREFVMELIPILEEPLEKFSGRLKWGSLLRSSFFFLMDFFLPDND